MTTPVRVRLETGDVTMTLDELRARVEAKTLAPLNPVSLDGGTSWVTATAALLPSGEDRVVGLFVPVKVEPTAMLAGYLALASFFFFGGPITLIAVVMASDPGPRLLVRLGAVAIAFVLGPLPIGWLGLRARRALQQRPELTGHARMWVALALAAMLALGGLVGVVLALVR